MSKISTKIDFLKISFLNELEKIEIFIVMCPSIFFPTPLPPGHLRVQSRGGLVQFRGWYPEAITRAIPWVLPGGRMGNQKTEWNITLKISIFANSCKNDIFEKNFFVGIFDFLW